MTRDGAVSVNLVTGETTYPSDREPEQDHSASGDTAGAAGKADDAALWRPDFLHQFEYKLLAVSLLCLRSAAVQLMGGETHINMVSYGGGVNSTALLVGLHQHRISVDLILFADTGAEHPTPTPTWTSWTAG